MIEKENDPMNNFKEPIVEKRIRERYHYTEEELIRLFEVLEIIHFKFYCAYVVQK